ncbi:ATP binding/leucine-tRNA ligases/aminoacyl-tRNA ligase [Actinidia rufa]|uniref:ATP binding/leucine-tRNA ligases/aminoacyl-tRNA ligase n=1 Tax=Actinidia rufa TaxID=165716 RepID=A0A7J0E2C6_9ERIC|nr:ATP binding/leucine-tRNA ligases/aminoacyl-tRNA ligase [Actinidia rufa]
MCSDLLLFHCTGLPIKASADKLCREIQKFAAKAGGAKFQWEIMQSCGLSDEEISKFQDPYYWLTYFPPLAVEDLKAFGIGCDWRRTFITTNMNLFFDSFLGWQMRKLKNMGKIVKDLRYTIYSPIDGLHCADHDRASGEEGKNGAFAINETDVFILTERAALNLAYQKLSQVPEKFTCLVELTGNYLLGLPLRSPLAFNDTIHSLPMLSILTDKGTGIVTSVPSDSPDDFMSLRDLKSKPNFRAKFGLKNDWVLPFDVIPIINTPEFGDNLLRRVQDAKSLIKSKLLELGEAVMYSEPEKKVMSRSGDECVVTLTDQWYITYGEPNWMDKFWTWDEVFLVESLSDSTIYMAYYTVCHFLQKGNMYGSDTSSLKPEQLTDEIWDFLFYGGPYPASSDLSPSLLNKMKQDFEYWYPLDLRVSGKDLIQNHLTFCIYSHSNLSQAALASRTIREPIEEFSADATRFSLADAGDGMGDATFVFEMANAAVLRLTKEISWMQRMTEKKNYSEYLFQEALKTGFYDLQAAWDEYRFSCSSGAMNRELLRMCLSSKRGGRMFTLKKANTYLQDSIVSTRKLLQKQVSGSSKKAMANVSSQQNKPTVGLVFVNEQYDGWKKECLNILRSKFDSVTCTFVPDPEIVEALRQSPIGQDANFKQNQKQCMPFLRFKKDEVMAVGVQALDLRLPFGEMAVLEENSELIKR